MEDLPQEFADALQDYNAQVTKVFGQYLTTVATEHERQRGEENKLPLSGIGKKEKILKEWTVGSIDGSAYSCFCVSLIRIN